MCVWCLHVFNASQGNRCHNGALPRARKSRVYGASLEDTTRSARYRGIWISFDAQQMGSLSLGNEGHRVPISSSITIYVSPIQVSEVIAGTPASLCGLKTGDCILKVSCLCGVFEYCSNRLYYI